MSTAYSVSAAPFHDPMQSWSAKLREHTMTKRRIAAATLLAAVSMSAEPTTIAVQPGPEAREIRALWVTRATLAAPGGIARMIRAAQDGGFNTLIVQVRGRGDAYYRSSLEPRAAELATRPDVDSLSETLTRARAAGIAVHAWVAVNLVASAVEIPTSPQHLVHRQPDWLMVPRQLARELYNADPKSPAYLRRLARWTRSRRDDVEGL